MTTIGASISPLNPTCTKSADGLRGADRAGGVDGRPGEIADEADGDAAEEAGTVLPAITRARKTMIATEITTNRENFTILAFILLLYLGLEYNQSAENNQGL